MNLLSVSKYLSNIVSNSFNTQNATTDFWIGSIFTIFAFMFAIIIALIVLCFNKNVTHLIELYKEDKEKHEQAEQTNNSEQSQG